MAKPFKETVNIQPQTFSTGKPQLFMSLADKLDNFSAQTAQTAERKVIQQATIEGQQAGIQQQKSGEGIQLKEETFIGGISKKAFNNAARESYVKSLENDIRENITKIGVDHPDDPVLFQEAIEAFSKSTIQGVDPAIKPQVELSIDAKVSQLKPRIISANVRKLERSANEENSSAEDSSRIDAVHAAYEGNNESAAFAMAVATDSISQRTDIGDDVKQKRIRRLNTEVKESQLARSIDDAYDSNGSDAAIKMIDSLKKPSGMELSDWNSFVAAQRANVNRRDARKKAEASIDLTLARKKLKEYQTAKSLGFEVSSDNESLLNELVSGTDLEKQKKIIDETAQFSVMSHNDRRQILSAAQTGKLDDVQAYAAALKADQEINKAAVEDGYSLGVKQGIVDAAPLDIGDPESFKVRMDQAEILSAHYNVDVSPLSDQEATALSGSIEDMTPDEKIALATTFQASPAIWGQLDKKNAGQFAMAGATGDQTVMSAIFKGQELLKQKLVKPMPQDDYLSNFNDIVEGVYGSEDRRAVLDASLSHYSSTSSAAISGIINSSDFEDSVMAVTGGIAKINGFNLELPRGVDDDGFEDFIDGLQPENIPEFGGVANHSDEEAIEAIKRGRIRSVGANKYMVENDGGTLFNDNGEPFVFSYSLDLATTNVALADSKRIAARRRNINIIGNKDRGR